MSTTTEQLINREEAIEQAKINLLPNLAAQLTSLTGQQWAAFCNTNKGAWVIGYVGRDDGAVLVISTPSYKGFRLEIYGNGPKDHNGSWDTRTRPASITMSGEKTPEQIAKDIIKRYLPEYNIWYAKEIERRDARNNAKNRDLAALNRLAALSGEKIRNPDSDNPSIHFDFGEGWAELRPASDGTWYIQCPAIPNKIAEEMAMMSGSNLAGSRD